MDLDFAKITDIAGKAGFNFMDILKAIPKIKHFFPVAKSFLKPASEWEKTLDLKENQKLIYSLAISDEKIMIYGFVTEETEAGTMIVDQKFAFDGFEKAEEFLNKFPNMPVQKS